MSNISSDSINSGKCDMWYIVPIIWCFCDDLKKPEDPEPWSTPYIANKLRSHCIQWPISAQLTHLGWNDFDEDCLYMNLYTPQVWKACKPHIDKTHTTIYSKICLLLGNLWRTLPGDGLVLWWSISDRGHLSLPWSLHGCKRGGHGGSHIQDKYFRYGQC